MKKLFFLSLMAIVCQMMQAFEVNGISYTIIDGEAVVVNPLHTADEVKEINFVNGYIRHKISSYTGDIVIPQSVSYEGKEYAVAGIAHQAFENCKGITSLQLPEGLKYIGKCAFEYCYLKELSIPSSVKKIGYYAFCCMPYLETITIKADIDTIPLGLLLYEYPTPSPLKEVILPASIKYIEKEAFCSNVNLETIVLPKTLNGIGERAFSGCRKLSIDIPDNVCYIGSEALSYTHCLANGMPSSLNKLEKSSFMAVYGLVNASIPSGVKEIPQTCFTACINLKTLELNEGLTSIGVSAFRSLLALEAVVLPSSLKKIDVGGFANCCKLRAIYSMNPLPPTLGGSNVFKGEDERYPNPSDAKIYVPLGCTEAYKAAGWGEYFSEIIEMDEVSQRAAFAKSVTGVTTVIAPSKTNSGYFNLQGQKFDVLQKGINIMRTEDGRAKKVYVK